MWASVIHEKKMKEKPKGMDEKIKIPVIKYIYIYMIHIFRAHMFTFSHSHPQIKSHNTRSNQKYLDRTTTKNSTHLHISIKVYDLYLLMVQALTWQHKCRKYAHLYTFPKAPFSALVVGLKGKHKCLW